MIIVISIILLIILSIILLTLYNKKKRQLDKEYREEYYNKHYQELEAEKQKFNEEFERHKEETMRKYHWWLSEREQERDAVERSLIERKQAVEEIIEQLENRRREAEKSYNEIIANEKEKINTELEFFRKSKLDGLNSTIQFEFSEKTAAANKAYEELVLSLEEEKRKKEAELSGILEEISDFQKKQSVINAEILRRREVEEKQDFFRDDLTGRTVQQRQTQRNGAADKFHQHIHTALPPFLL